MDRPTRNAQRWYRRRIDTKITGVVIIVTMLAIGYCVHLMNINASPFTKSYTKRPVLKSHLTR